MPLPKTGQQLSVDGYPKPGETTTGLSMILANKPSDGEVLQIMEIGGVSMTRKH